MITDAIRNLQLTPDQAMEVLELGFVIHDDGTEPFGDRALNILAGYLCRRTEWEHGQIDRNLMNDILDACIFMVEEAEKAEAEEDD